MQRFTAPAWAWLVTGAMLALLLGLGGWQVRRAHEKENLDASYAHAGAEAPLALTRDSIAPASAAVVAATVEGTYEGERQLLLDNQSHQGRPGYRVWTPLRLSAGGTVIVDRGWVPADPQRAIVPDVSVSGARRSLRGLWRNLPRPGLKLANPNLRAPGRFPAVVDHPTVEDLQAILGEPVAAGVLLLDPAEKEGYLREWNPTTRFPPSRHYAYAAQWFALAATLLIIFVRMNLKSAK